MCEMQLCLICRKISVHFARNTEKWLCDVPEQLLFSEVISAADSHAPDLISWDMVEHRTMVVVLKKEKVSAALGNVFPFQKMLKDVQ